MKTNFPILFRGSVWFGALSLSVMLSSRAIRAQETGFTYQGRLNDGGAPANGLYDVRFQLFDAPAPGTQLGNSITNSATEVTNGLFTVTLDFGAVFPGGDRWLEIAVRTNGPGAFVTLAPRQELTPSPYAITAENVMSGGLQAGTYGNAFTFNNPANSFSGNGGGLTEVNAATLGGFGAGAFWRTTGNAGTTAGPNFLGTTDNQPLELQVNGTRGLRIEPHATDAPSLVGGYFQNSVAGVSGSVIAGGGSSALANAISGNYSFIGSGLGNTNLANFSLIGSGANNFIGTGSDFSLINGGEFNFIQSTAQLATIGGGFDNRILTNGDMATISGGHDNAIQSARFAVISGGGYNLILTDSYDSTIGGGGYNQIQTNSHSTTIGGGAANLIQANNPYATIGGGVNNLIQTNSDIATIAGGHDNFIGSAPFSTIGGGGLNQILLGAYDAVIGGGGYNNIQTNSVGATISGGDFNWVDTNSTYASIGGGYANAIYANASASTIGGGWGNLIQQNTFYGTIAGGANNNIQTNSHYSTIGGGYDNMIQSNTREGTIGGGLLNIIQTNASFSTIGGGFFNTIQSNASYAVVPGGSNNVAGANFSFAAGQQAEALHQGSFVWADSQNAPFASTANDQFNVRAQGGVRFQTGGAGLSVDGEPAALLSAGQTFTGANLFNNLSNSFSGNGGGLTNVNAAIVGGLDVSNFWQLGGNYSNSYTVLGTRIPGRPLFLYAGNQQLLKLDAVQRSIGIGSFSVGGNMAGGSDQNLIWDGVLAGTIAGGGSANYGPFGLSVSPYPNVVSDDFGTIGGGVNNLVGNTNSDVTDVQAATVSGGQNNQATSSYATIGGGIGNQASGSGAFVGGGGYDGSQTAGNIASGAAAVIAGGIVNTVTNTYGTIGGGIGNTNNGVASTIAGGWLNRVSGQLATIGGGKLNVAAGDYSTVSGGDDNSASGQYALIGGGIHNRSTGDYASVPGGYGNQATASLAVVGGGFQNQASGSESTVPGGHANVAAGQYSFGAGQQAQALHRGSFVWADSQNAVFASSANDEFLIRAAGGMGINKNNPASTLDVNGTARIQGANGWDINNSEGDFRVGNDTYRFKIGVAIAGSGAGDVWMRAHGGTGRVFLKTPGGTTIFSNEGQTTGVSLAAGGGAWSSLSDRNQKENFRTVDSQQILRSVLSLPLTTWNYKSQEKSVRHIGPMAQDFAAAFHVGEDDRHITTIDADGVALAAIQGLNQKLEEQAAEMEVLKKQNDSLDKRVSDLEALLKQAITRR